ncbi:cell division cycle-associated protein 3 [Solea solea]|uniref:cell division cycle-associated protein 3 n=1 Tax=Solea solea TaxID=90069 RepID=UPI00272A4E27|nr:cell division cycle-associated protein 3 [Solea solea]
MGSSESKMPVSAPMKPEPAVRKSHASHLIDPRSPSTNVDRTPIQVIGPVAKSSAVGKSECPLAFTDPRSPTIGIVRTPVREVMRAKVGSFARRLGMLFHNESEGKFTEAPQKCFSDAVEEEVVYKDEELASTEPLLTPQPSQTYSSLAEHANLLATPVLGLPQSVCTSSPFVVLEVQVETVDVSLEEAEEARESPLHKRLSMSLITCHEGAPSSQVLAEVHHDSTSSAVPDVAVELLGDGVDHSYGVPSITVEPESQAEPSPTSVVGDSPVQVPSVQPEEAEIPPSSEETKELAEGNSLPPAAVSSEPPTNNNLEQPQLCSGIRCPTFDSKSPSQVVFKPQWLGKGFGGTGLRARGVQGQNAKRGSSPLAVRLAVKNTTNENKGHYGKVKQKGSEGRSPLQILKETNSPRDQRSQMKLKVSTPDRQRPGLMDRRVLAVAVDKENR